MKRAFALLVAVCFLILGTAVTVGAVPPSGPGQTTANKSVSVVFASDAPAITIDGTGLATSANQTTIIGHVDGIETLIGTTNTTLTTLDGRVDGLETLITATNASLELIKQPTRTAAVTPSDATDLAATCTKGIWVGTGGNVAVRGSGDASASTLSNVPSGTYVPGALQRVMATNTTASNIVCFYGP